MTRFSYLAIVTLFIFCLYANQAWALPGDLKVKILDIGQGDSILIQTPHGKNIIVDGGPGVALIDELGKETSYWQKTIDMIVLTNPDRDHMEGFLELMRRYDVKRVLFTGVVHETATYREFLRLVDENHIPAIVASPDQDWELDDGVFLDVLAPVHSIAGQELRKSNNGSVMARLVYGDTALMLTGDAEAPEEHQLLLTDNDLSSQILKSGHHGSRTSGSTPFLLAVRPERSIMSNGKKNPYGHPHLETLLGYDALGIDWLSTKDVGTVTIMSDGQSWQEL